jgi:hypothetical protein
MQNKFHWFMITSLSVAGLAALMTASATSAKADAWDKMTYVTFHEKMIAGNKVLQPGTYVWKLLDSESDRHVVQIFDKDQQHLEETILAIPNYRLEPTGNTRFAFWETPPGVPKAIRAWFYPGDNFGQEFTYPKKLIAKLASAAPVAVSESYKEPVENAPSAAATPAPAPEPAPQPEAAEPAPAPQPQQTPETTNPPQAEQTPTVLPHTASNIPLIGFLGLACFGLAGAVSLAAKRT